MLMGVNLSRGVLQYAPTYPLVSTPIRELIPCLIAHVKLTPMSIAKSLVLDSLILFYTSSLLLHFPPGIA